jgi:hypothetical protein
MPLLLRSLPPTSCCLFRAAEQSTTSIWPHCILAQRERLCRPCLADTKTVWKTIAPPARSEHVSPAIDGRDDHNRSRSARAAIVTSLRPYADRMSSEAKVRDRLRPIRTTGTSFRFIQPYTTWPGTPFHAATSRTESSALCGFVVQGRVSAVLRSARSFNRRHCRPLRWKRSRRTALARHLHGGDAGRDEGDVVHQGAGSPADQHRAELGTRSGHLVPAAGPAPARPTPARRLPCLLDRQRLRVRGDPALSPPIAPRASLDQALYGHRLHFAAPRTG